MRERGGEVHLICPDAKTTHDHQFVGLRQNFFCQLGSGPNAENSYTVEPLGEVISGESLRILFYIRVASGFKCLPRSRGDAFEKQNFNLLLIEGEGHTRTLTSRLAKTYW